MKILIVTPHFYPESFRCNEMAFELQRRGHKVSVMTAIPDYPAGKFLTDTVSSKKEGSNKWCYDPQINDYTTRIRKREKNCIELSQLYFFCIHKSLLVWHNP